MSDTHIWNVEIVGTQVIGYINGTESTFYPGPFAPDTDEMVASVRFGNSGDATGQMNVYIFEWNGQSWTAIRQWNRTMSPGEEVTQGMTVTTPSTTGPWHLAVAVWGETETQPTLSPP